MVMLDLILSKIISPVGAISIVRLLQIRIFFQHFRKVLSLP